MLLSNVPGFIVLSEILFHLRGATDLPQYAQCDHEEGISKGEVHVLSCIFRSQLSTHIIERKDQPDSRSTQYDQ